MVRFLATTAVILVASVVSHAFSTYAKWSSTSITMYVNPSNADLPASAAIAAIQSAMASWNASGSAFRWTYGGTASDTATALDYRNVAIFRNTTNGSAIATTYSWWDSSVRLIDSDVVYWDGGTTFFGGSSGCTGSHAAYLEDIAAHELGHVLGLNHSSFADSTMKSSYGNCSQTQRSPWLDDMAGAQSLYPTTGNAKPTISVSNPANNTSFTFGAPVVFAGSASDPEDGNRSGSMVWISSRDGQLGTGGSFSQYLTIGTHLVTTFATDSRGLVSSKPVNVTVVPALVPTLAALPYYTPVGARRVNLLWSGFLSSVTSVELYRNGVKATTTANDGKHVDSPGTSLTSYGYRLCAIGGAICTNQMSVSF
jgi:hypothetical protein